MNVYSVAEKLLWIKILLFYCFFDSCIFDDSCEHMKVGEHMSDSNWNMQMFLRIRYYMVLWRVFYINGNRIPCMSYVLSVSLNVISRSMFVSVLATNMALKYRTHNDIKWRNKGSIHMNFVGKCSNLFGCQEH